MLIARGMNYVPRFSETRWNYFSQIVSYVEENAENLVELFTDLSDKFKHNHKEKERCLNFIVYLQEKKENKFLWLIEKILANLNILSKIMQTVNLTIYEATGHIKGTVSKLELIKTSFPDNPEFVEYVDKATLEIKNRLQKEENLNFIEMLDYKNFEKYSKDFPEQHFKMFFEKYKSLNINKTKLKNEMIYLYGTEDARDIGFLGLKKYLIEIFLEVYSEVVTVLNMFLTLGTSTANAERSFSTLKRIKKFLRNKNTTERTSALAILSFERECMEYLMEEKK